MSVHDLSARADGAIALAAAMNQLCDGHSPAQVLAAVTSVLANQVAALAATDKDARRLTTLVQSRTLIAASDLIALRESAVH